MTEIPSVPSAAVWRTDMENAPRNRPIDVVVTCTPTAKALVSQRAAKTERVRYTNVWWSAHTNGWVYDREDRGVEKLENTDKPDAAWRYVVTHWMPIPELPPIKATAE